MAAHAQGKFWEMHDKLFANQQALDRASLEKYAQEIGLNMGRYKADMEGHKHKANIEADSKRGNEVDPIRLRPHPFEFHLYYDN